MIARMTRRETPTSRVINGKRVYQARWTDHAGKRRNGWKDPHGIPGNYRLKRDAQKAIDQCYELDAEGATRPDTVGGYAASWLKIHPRSKVTNKTNTCRLNAVLDVVVEGAALREWPFDLLRRRHANALVGHLLDEGRARTGVVNILGVLSAMVEDAIDDEAAVQNPFKGVKVKASDPRIQRGRTPVRVFEWSQMHDFAKACARGEGGTRALREWRAVFAEPMVRVLSDCGLRAGELLALERTDLDLKAATLRVERTVAGGEVLEGTKSDHHTPGEGRTVPVPPELLGLLRGMLGEAMKSQTFWASSLLFPAPRGGLWNYQSWWAQVWVPGREVSGLDVRPHEMRHSWVSLIRAAGVNPADAADVAGHTEAVATARYSHSLGRSFEAIREAVGQ